jgi:predicted transcriptional regulator
MQATRHRGRGELTHIAAHGGKGGLVMAMVMEQQMFSIGEVSRMLDVESHTLRYWEKEFKDFIKPRRVSRKNRVYTEADIAVLRKIKELLTVELFTIAGARRQMYLRTASGF